MTIPHTATDQITCPWCGHTWKPGEQTLKHWDRYGVESPEQCGECDRVYEFTMRLNRTYTTIKVEEG